MVELGEQPQGPVTSQGVAELSRDPHGQHDGHPASDPQNLHMVNLPQAGEYAPEPSVGQRQGITARENDLTDGGPFPDIVDDGRQLDRCEKPFTSLPEASAVAVAAVDSAAVGHDDKAPVAEAMDETRYGTVGSLIQRVILAACVYFPAAGNALQADGIEPIASVQEREIVWRGRRSGGSRHRIQRTEFRRAQWKRFRHFVGRPPPIPELPSPVIPAFGTIVVSL
jgi:hypothetical protein